MSVECRDPATSLTFNCFSAHDSSLYQHIFAGHKIATHPLVLHFCMFTIPCHRHTDHPQALIAPTDMEYTQRPCYNYYHPSSRSKQLLYLIAEHFIGRHSLAREVQVKGGFDPKDGRLGEATTDLLDPKDNKLKHI